jgi:hypothetical protein
MLRLPNRRLFGEIGLIYRRSAHTPAAVRAIVEVAHDWPNWLPSAQDVVPIGLAPDANGALAGLANA